MSISLSNSRPQWNAWTPEKRKRLSLAAKKRWANLPPKERERRLSFIKPFQGLGQAKKTYNGLVLIGSPAFRVLVSSYRGRAKSSGIEFLLTSEECSFFFTSRCHYCGVEPSQKCHAQRKIRETFVYNGIDRKDPTKGYVASNCVACCGFCNHAKSMASYEEFLDWIQRVFQTISLRENVKSIDLLSPGRLRAGI